MLLLTFVLQAAQQSTQPILGYLGFAMDSVPLTVKAHFPSEVADAEGVIVTRLDDISPAADDGIKLYDVLIAYDDQPITRVEELIAKISNDTPGRKVQFKVIRQGNILTIPVTLWQQPWVSLEQLEMKQYLPLTNTRKAADKPKSIPQSRCESSGSPIKYHW